MIIVEGPDGTGKSTLVESLRKELRAGANAVVHCGPPPKTAPDQVSGAWTQYVNMLLDDTLPSNGIMDRFIYGERVYGPILRKDYRFTLAHQRMLERILSARRAVVVYTHPPYGTGFRNWSQRTSKGQELFTDPTWYRDTWDAFDRVNSQTQLPKLTWDPFRLPVSELVRQIQMIKTPINPGPGHGVFSRMSVLLVGNFMSSSTRPFDWTGVEYEGPMLSLTQQLIAADIPERDLYWVNSHVITAHRSTRRNANFIEDLNPRKIIAVGEYGNDWCGQLDRPFVSVPDVNEWFRQHPFSTHPLIEHVLTR